MNMVLDEAEEVSAKRKTRKPVGAGAGRGRSGLGGGVAGIWGTLCTGMLLDRLCTPSLETGGIAGGALGLPGPGVLASSLPTPYPPPLALPRPNEGRILLKGDTITLMRPAAERAV